MGVINIIKNIKLIHEKDVILIRVGKFYYSYGKDSYLMSYLFHYKLTKIEGERTYSCAFPEQSYKKVTAQLENKKINYLIVNRRNNYEVEERFDNKNLNCYKKYFEKAKKYIDMKRRIENISNYLIQNIDKEEIKTIIEKMEEIINETRKI